MTHQAQIFALTLALGLTSSSFAAASAPSPAPVKHQITGLFSPDRVDDLKEAMTKLPDIKLVEVDFERAEATFIYDAKRVFNNPKPEQLIERFDSALRQASHSTFGVRPLSTTPAEKIKRIEIAVIGLDCKACAYAAYSSVYKIPGVESATVDFKNGIVAARIDPEKTNAEALTEALKQKGVKIKEK